MNKKTRSRAKLAVGIGAGLAAAAAAAAGVFLLSKPKNRRKVKSWAIAARREVVARLKRMKKVDQKAYRSLVEQAVKKYGQLKKVDQSEILQAASEIKSQWQKIQAQIKSATKKPTKKKTSRKR